MTKDQLNQANDILDQQKWLHRLFETIQDNADFSINLEDRHQRRITAVFTEISEQLQQEFKDI